jgi:hypothetical protein
MKKWIAGMLLGLSVATLAVMGALAGPAQTQAFAITRTPLRPLAGDALKAALSNFFKREQNFLTLQANYLKEANDVSVTAQNLITAAKSEGKDTVTLETALAQYETDIAQAKSANTSAASLIIVHDGFDGGGKVTDSQAAYQTDLNTRLSLRKAHDLVVQAVTALRQSVAAWRQTH